MKRLLIAAAMAAPATPAAAHVVVADAKAEPGAYHAAFFRVSHGCEASPTVSVRVEIPPDIVSAKPQPKPGWSLSVETERLPSPAQGESGPITTRVKAVTWRGRLEADQFDQFGLMVRLPQRAGPVYFPTVQTCEAGENRWVEIPAAGAAWTSTPHPAPVIDLGGGAAAADPHAGHAGH